MTTEKKKIVVAEDSPDHARILVAILEKCNFEVLWFQNGQDALDHLMNNPMPDLLITDIMMPGISGFELMSHLKSESKMPLTLVISGCQREEDVLRGLQYGAEDYLSKPFSPKIVMAKVQNMFERKGASLKKVAFSAALFLISFLLPVSNGFAEPASGNFSATQLVSEKYTGILTGTQVSLWFSKKIQARIFTRDLQREYTDHSKFREWAIGGGILLKRPWGYIDVSGSYTPNPVTFSRSQFAFDPHWVNGKNDFGLMLGYSHYEMMNTYTGRPTWFREFGAHWRAGLGVWVVKASQWVLSEQASVVFLPGENHQIRLDGAVGRVVEDADAIVAFRTLSASYRVEIKKAVAILVGGSRYWSDTRTENSFTASLEIK